MVIAAGSNPPLARPSDSAMPMSASSRRRVAGIVAAGQMPGGAGKDDGVLQLEADRHLLHRLQDHRVEPADGTEVQEPQRPLAIHEDVPRMGVAVVQPVAQHLIEERPQQPGGEDLRRHR